MAVTGPGATIVVIGNATRDVTYRLDRLPLPGETRLADATMNDCGGKGLNQAVAAARAGGRVAFFAAVGDDAVAEAIRAALAAEPHIEAHLWTRHGRASDESVILLDAAGENAIVSTAACARSVTAAEVVDALTRSAAGDILLMQGNLSLEATRAGLAAARARGLLTLWNPAPCPPGAADLLPLADLLVVNKGEAEAIFGAVPSTRPAHAARLVVTLGAEGARIFDGTARIAIAAPAVSALDTAGAGDAFVGTLAAGLAAGLALPNAAAAAVAQAALVVTRPGTLGAIRTLAVPDWAAFETI
ncbi:PfkB family carbohydrate kinase [Acuticoccus kandeliae]|uniref:PfkB family carbohydrate kinase n=1 Tax=Acuticoccus kandeliae TaxID=2073160 RepID=UPI000D3E4C4F|nr:PfkB family carbohydrate kinase [Acuticoccus kandeliae]